MWSSARRTATCWSVSWPSRNRVTITATLITLHPLPTHGGFMDSHVYRKASYRLPALAGVAVLRFNTRGTASPRGTSDGAFEEGIGERFDVEAAVRFAVERGTCPTAGWWAGPSAPSSR